MSEQVRTPSGALEGTLEEGVRVWKGIPFAEAPVGERRFRAPEPLPAWEGVRAASEFGGSAPQNPILLPLPGMSVGAMDEDCLYLNVWAPAAPSEPRPVMVWIHGGGFVIGSGSQPIYDGAELARRGDVVVVTVNYRLGALGFLDVVDRVPGAVSNPGLRDQIAGLRWVRDHIEAFGGDPENVTIFGESAGGMSVGSLLGSPEAAGLFHKAIPQSGACHHFHTREVAGEVVDEFLRLLGVPATALAEVPVEKLVEAQGQLMLALGTRLGLLPFQPVLDEDVLPEPALARVREGGAADVPVLVGSTRDEWRLFSLMDPELAGLDEEKLVARLGRDLPEVHARETVELYRSARAERGDPHDLASLLFATQTDRIFRIPAIRLAESQRAHTERVFMYRVDWEAAFMNGLLGACHAVELPFVFGTHGQPGSDQFAGTGPDVEALAGRMMDAWSAFARTGDPGWEPYDEATRPTRIFDRTDRTESDPMSPEREHWTGLI